MSDIFLNYARADDDKAARLASVFESQGWMVWRNLDSTGVRSFRTRDREIEDAKVVVVLWSQRASESFWVTNVIERARRRKRLVVVLLENIKPPPGVSPSEAFDMSDWDGGVKSRTWMYGVPALLERVRAFAGHPGRRGEPLIPVADTPRPGDSNRPPPQDEHAAPSPEDDKRFEGVFISYRRDEAAAYAGRLYDRLAARFGREKVFLDMENVGWGEDFVEAITAAAESCAVMIVLVSRQWARDEGADDYVRLEVAAALGRKVRVIPILIQGASMPALKELPEDLAPLVRRNALALSDTRWERDVEDLIKTLENLVKD